MTAKFTGFPWEGDKLVRPTEVASYLNINNSTLAKWRRDNFGPAYVWFESGAVLYSLNSVKNFAKQQKNSRHMDQQNKSFGDPLGLLN